MQRRAQRGEARAWLDKHLERIKAGDRTSSCILWPFSTNGGNGGRYPQIKVAGRTVRVTRYIMKRILGRSLNPGELVRHSCDTPQCVNFQHLEIGSQADNMSDMIARCRQAAGERNGCAKLTRADLEAIRTSARFNDTRGSVAAPARAYGVTATTIALIRDGKLWHVPTRAAA